MLISFRLCNLKYIKNYLKIKAKIDCFIFFFLYFQRPDQSIPFRERRRHERRTRQIWNKNELLQIMKWTNSYNKNQTQITNPNQNFANYRMTQHL
jgi:hypothetical protein